MKKVFLSLLIFSFSVLIFGQTKIFLNSNKTETKIIENTNQKLIFSNTIEGFELATAKTKNGMYSRLIIPEYFPNNHIGYPELPVSIKLIEIPDDSNIEIKIQSFEEQIIDINEYGAEFPIVPNQASLFKNQDPATVPFEQNESIYSDFEYYETDLVKIEYLSTMRGIRIAQLTISPFSYDIESNTLTIKNNIVAEISFNGANITKSEQLKAAKYSPAFDALYHKIGNYK